MARKKEPPKPMFTLRHDFEESLKNFCVAGLLFYQVVDIALSQDLIKEPAATMVREKMERFRAAMMSDD
jgi:hypothetical protein